MNGKTLFTLFVSLMIDCQTGEILVHESQPDLDSILSDLFP